LKGAGGEARGIPAAARRILKDPEFMNIREIAKRCGVSVATVSRVLNHPENVAEPTRRKIESIMKAEGYTPNWFARGLNLGRTDAIGLMIPHILNPGDMEIAKGVEDVAHKKGYTTLLCNAENDAEKERNYIVSLLARKVDGIVLISSLLENREVHEVVDQGVPVVLVGENRDIRDVPIVRVDCRGAARRAALHLIENGYRRIAAVTGITPELENNYKLEGYEQALAENGAPLRREYLIRVENSAEGGYAAGRRLMEIGEIPNGVLASSDVLAIGVMSAVKEAGLRRPEDVSIVGFDNISMSYWVDPKLTTMEKPLHKMGVVGARLLFDIMDMKGEEQRAAHRVVLLEEKLKIRRSSGHKERIGEMF
jgi:DNA-binding LacI/PurR family transcriptional regulator